MILAAFMAASLEVTGVRGERLRPLEPSGSANVLLFAATDCPVSNGYAPEIQRVCDAYAARGVHSPDRLRGCRPDGGRGAGAPGRIPLRRDAGHDRR